MNIPNKNTLFPIEHYKRLCFLKNQVKNPQIKVGDYTYYDDFDSVENFEKNVKYLFDFNGDELIIGNFSMIASDVVFIMNGGNHLTDAISTYPFSVFGGDWVQSMEGKEYPKKGNTIVGNDVWIGYGATIMPGITIGDGAIIATKSVVIKDVAPYSIVGGNPAKEIKKRFSEDKIQRLLALKWWDWPIEKITEHLHLLTGNDLDRLLNV